PARGSAGACYGGRAGDTADNFDIATDAEHVAAVVGPNATGRDFGFSFNVVTRTSDTDTQGTLRRFLNNAITVTGANAMRFVPAVPTNANSGANNWWRTDVASALPVVLGASTSIDGAAYDLTDGTTAINPNDADLGAVRTVGRTGAYTTPQLDPEYEIRGSNAIPYGLDIQAASAAIRNISIWGFGDYLPAPVESVIRVGVNAASSFAAPTIEQNVIGASPASFTDPGAGPRSGGHLIQLHGVDGGTVQSNLIGFAGYNAVELEDDAGTWNILTNEIRSSGLSVGSGAERQGGIDIDGDASGSLFQGNLIVDTAADALENWRGPGGFTVVDNTIENTGQRGVENMAIRVFGTGTIIENNVLDGGSGPAIIVAGANSSAPWPAATGNRLSQNEFRNNAGNSIDLMAASTVVSEYDDGDGITVNDAATPATSGNIGLDYPTITSAVDGGASTTVAGTSCASCRVEIYEAVAGAGDTLAGTDYGEGDRYVGFATADGSGNWSFLDATIGTGDVLSAIAIDGANNTSEFSANATVTSVGFSGSIFEDIAGDAVKDGGDPGRGGVDVRLYLDDGDGVPDGGDTLVDSAVTAGDGSYSLIGGAGNHWIVVDSTDVTPSAGGTGVAEQTYGPVGAVCTNGDSPETQTTRGTAGPCYGGRRGDVADNFTMATNAEHVALVNGATGSLDFGFSFNAVTRTSDANTQGTLRRFLNNAITVTGANAMRFVPTVPTNDTEPVGDWWIVTLGGSLPVISGADTTIDGTAYDQTDGATIRDTNGGEGGNPDFPGKWVGTGANGVVEDGGDDPTLPSYLKPELEIDGNDTGRILDIGGDSVTVRRVSLYNSGGVEAVYVSAGTGSVLRESFVGPRADGTEPVAADKTGHGIEVYDGAADVIDNFFAFTGDGAIIVGDDSLVQGNDVYWTGTVGTPNDGISLEAATPADTITIRENRVDQANAYGLEGWNGPGGWTIEDNTFSNSGRGVHAEGGGVRLFGSGSTFVHNRVVDNRDAGLVLAERSAPGSNKFNLISQNSFSGNGAIAIDQDQTNIGAVNPNGDGITANSGAAATCGYTVDRVNEGIDFPAITSAIDGGATTTVAGTACPNSTVEVYRAVTNGFTDNTDPIGGTGVDHGEGATYVGSAAVDGSGDWTFVDASLNTADVITALAFDATNNTSEFSANAIVSAAQSISGVVFEDAVGDALNDGVVGDGLNPGVVGATVRLYRDTNTNGLPDGADTLVSTQVTGAGGAYSFTGLGNGTYWVAADSATVSPAAGVDASYSATTPRAEQTYGPDRGWCADGLGATAERTGAGPCYGGQDGATADNAATLPGSEHISRAVVAGAAVANVDFGFSYNVVTNLQAAFAGALDAPSYQGSLDQFLRNANAIVGVNAMRFVPAVPTNAAGGGGTWWQIDYTGTIAGQTPVMSHDAGTTVDGTAYDLADGVAVRDTNGNYLGANALGGMLVGVGDVPLPQVEKPELELIRSDSGIGAALPVDANAATSQSPDNFTVRSMAISGWARSIWMASVAGFRPTGVTIEDNVLGSGPSTFADPGVPGTIHGVYVRATDGGSLSNNLIGFVDNDGAVLADVAGWTIAGNEVREAAQVNAGSDGINDGAGSSGNTISGNLIVDSGGFGLDGTTTGDTITNNTITGSGVLGLQTAGIRRTAGPNTISSNILTGNAGAGIVVPDSDAGMLISGNHFGGNGTIAIDLVALGGSNDAGDGVSVNDGATVATTGNIGRDYPVITDAYDTGPSSTIIGTACANCRVEIYTAAADGDGSDTLAGTDYGEGVTYLGFANADGSGDWSYVDASLSTGSVISTIAIDGANNTSEFSPNSTVVPAQGISGVVFEDIVGDVLNDGVIGDALNPGVAGVTVRLYRDTNANGMPDGADTLVSSQVTPVGGAYSFIGLAPATYYVAVDSTTLGAPAWAEQTFGPAGAWDGSGFSGGAGPFYGGAGPTASDVPVSLATAEHVARAVVAGGSVANVDFGFSFNVVVNVEDAGQGSLRQFLANANAVGGANAMYFVPAVPTNATDGGGNDWWSILVDAQLPTVTGDSTTIDGTAHDATDGATVLDSNAASLGAAVNPGLDGGYTTPTLDPEFEIIGDRTGTPVRDGLDIRADNVTVRDLAIYGFGDPDAIVDADLHFWSALNGVVEQSVVGGRAGSGVAPPAAERTFEAGIAAFTSSTVTVRDSIIQFTDEGLRSATSSALTVTGNEIAGNSFTGISVGNTAAAALIEGNHLSGNGSFGSIWLSEPATVRDNTVQNSSVGLFISSADVSGSLVTRNVFTGNSGDGIYLTSSSVNQVHITENHFGGNGGQAIDLRPVGISPNTGVAPACGYEVGAASNDGIDFPVIVSAVDTGPSTTVTGVACANARIEVYRAVAGAGDTLAGTDYGEGTAYLGFTTADAAGDWSYVDATLSVGDVISTLAIDGSNNTSEFSANATVVAFTVSGKVFEDIAGEVLADGPINNAANPGVGNVTVYLYRDGGDGLPDGVDDGVSIASTTTDATPGPTLGDYSFGALPDGTYWVVADSKTVAPSAGVNSAPADDDDVWAEQTYAAAGGFDGAGFLGANGPLIGGKTGDGADDASSLATAEHINRVVVSGGNVAGADFGFSFNVVTNLEAGDATDADPAADRVFQGSLRQFILNANALVGANAMRFVPSVGSNGSLGGNDWWRIDVTNDLPDIADAVTTIDGRAYSSADGVTVRNDNDANIGTGGAVGLGGIYSTPQLDPELEIKGDDVVTYGLNFLATADGSTVRDVAIARFDFDMVQFGGNLADDINSITVEYSVFGAKSPADFSFDAVAPVDSGITGDYVTNSTIRNNLIRNTNQAIHLEDASTDNLVETNETRGSNTGIYLKGSATDQPERVTIRGNAFMESGWWGIRMYQNVGDHIIAENTVRLGGNYGIELEGTTHSVTGNIISDNGREGIRASAPLAAARISRNQFGGNGEIAIDLGGDGITVNDDLDGDLGPNGLLNYPVITSAVIVGPNLVVSGLARTGDEIEFYEAAGAADDNNLDGIPHGEGVDYLFTAFEGSVAVPVDTDPAGGSYSTVGYGSDTAAQLFSFTLPVPAGLVAGDELTALGISGSNTSEFGPNVIVNRPPVAVDDPGNSTNEDTVVTIAVLGNDSDPDLDPVTISSFDAASVNGATITVDDNGTPLVFTDDRLSYDPAANWNGAGDTFTYTITDGRGQFDTATVTVTVAAVNDEPSFSMPASPDRTVLEDSGAFSEAGFATGMSAGPADEAGQTLTFNVSNDNNLLFLAQPDIDETTGNLSFTLAADANGSATVSVYLADDGGVLNGGDDTSPTQTFVITVTPVNDEPSFAGGGDVSVGEDSGAYSAPWAGSISMGPTDEAGQSGSFNITANTNAGLFSAGPTVDATGTLTFTPTADANGTADITLELQDDGGVANGGDDTSTSVTFTITVTAVNDEPSFVSGGDVGVLEDSGAYSAPWASAMVMGPADEAGQSGSFNIRGNTNPGLFSAVPAVDGSGGLTFTPAADANGFADITIELQDNGGVLNGGDDTSASVMFRIT
ncbi:MAG: cadherin-like domain-containing protein, partial [Acidimicrobiia bacterium]|nr:cadherin-like domain-containing protein [Acidimicrobiia bacterium]